MRRRETDQNPDHHHSCNDCSAQAGNAPDRRLGRPERLATRAAVPRSSPESIVAHGER